MLHIIGEECVTKCKLMRWNMKKKGGRGSRGKGVGREMEDE